MHRYREDMTAEEALAFAFTLTEELARLLHTHGHWEMAALLYGIGDVGELSRKRTARRGAAGLTGPGGETLDFVLDQMGQLSELMTRHGVDDAAVLFRMPVQLRLAAQVGSAAAASMAA